MDEDVGIRTVRDVFQGLQVDDEWSTWSDRGFTWWPHRLAQRVWSDDVREDDGPIVARVNAEIDLFSIGAEDWTNLLPVFEGASTFATMSGFLWNDGVVRLRCSMWVHDDVQAWVARIFQFATLAQAVSAEQSTTEMDQMAVHESGHRDQPDEMLRAIDVLPGSSGPSAWAGKEIETVAEILTSNGVPSLGSEASLSAEFPYGERGGPAAPGGTSNLLMVSTEEPHPSLGFGLLMRLNLREHPSLDRKPLGAVHLNQLELADGCPSHFLGSWCTNPSGGPPVFVSFLPSVLSAPNLLLNLVMSMGLRSRWASEKFSGETA